VTSDPRFDTVLIANRGEIARRVIRTARALGLRTVAVYSDADRSAPHVFEADTAVRIGAAPAIDSYLAIDALIEAARSSGAGAVHPGYGFLSESAEFARACERAGLVFIGPPAALMEMLGRKDRAREVASAAGLPVATAVALDGPDPRGMDALALVGLPAIVKAVAGGGGKGMRIVREPAELPEAITGARREAAAAFGDGSLILERYVEHGRHIEVQVFGDEQDNVVHLFERDCSVQRRHQKVLEESPAPTISGALRARLSEAAVSLARHVGYVGAGTVEFLVSGAEAFFLEMNTRLQVEHPVTEAVTGLDLVAWQFAVAQGRPLPLSQGELSSTGHAIEVRLYAEDPDGGFLPQSGTPIRIRVGSDARVDSGIVEGEPVGSYYDPLLAKLTVHGADRSAARAALLAALDASAIFGLQTNLGFLRRLVASGPFEKAAIDTGWLDRELPAPADDERAFLGAAWLAATGPLLEASGAPLAPDGWRSAGPPRPIRVELDGAGGRWTASVQVSGVIALPDGRSFRAVVHERDGERLRLELDGEEAKFLHLSTPTELLVAHQGTTHRFARRPALGTLPPPARSDGLVLAPMPGVVVSVAVVAGDVVEQRSVLGVLESMKMQLPLQAPLAGTVLRVEVGAGDQVKLNQTLFALACAHGGD
jgi:acetyl-CoA/propionyl-CoA carboxylase biotin carboxyl carrier protein